MGDKEKIQWHPAFQQAIRAELSEYSDSLSFIEEYQLTTEPLKIDCLIIKKPPDVHIEKNIGRIFRGHNIVEYKSPDDTFTVDDYNKVFAYAYLYASLTRTGIKDMTVTLVVSKHPRDLLRYLKSELSLEVEKKSSGIYYVRGERMPIQIVMSKALPEEENLWLRSLRGGLEKPTLKRLLSEGATIGGEISAYLYAVAVANRKMVRGDAEMSARDVAELLIQYPKFVDAFEKLGYGDVKRAAEIAAAQAAEIAAAQAAAQAAERALKLGDRPEHVAQVQEMPLSKVLEIQENLSKPG